MTRFSVFSMTGSPFSYRFLPLASLTGIGLPLPLIFITCSITRLRMVRTRGPVSKSEQDR